MADMRAAGLNPILAYSQGGASAPSGAMAHVENTMEALGQGVSSAGQMARNVADLQKVKAETANTESQEKVNNEAALLNKANTVKAAQDTMTSAAQMEKAKAEAALTTEELGSPAVRRALMGSQSHSAYQAGEVSRREAEDRHKYGDSVLGRNLGSFERIAKRVYDALDRRPTAGGHSAVSNERPKTLRELRPEWFK